MRRKENENQDNGLCSYDAWIAAARGGDLPAKNERRDPQGLMLTLPYVCIGIGCGLFGHGMGNTISGRIVRSNPEMRKKLEIEEKDERNLSITNCAKGKAFDRMTWVYGALMLSFALMGVDMLAVLLLVFAYLLVHSLALYYRFRLDREM